MPLLLTPLSVGAFQRYMKRVGKLGGQNKVPRVIGDQEVLTSLRAFAAEQRGR